MLSINRKHKNTNGFNLIELMIVIVILASLIAVGVVKYNSYLKRAGITTAANYMDGMKAKVTIYLANNNDTPPDDMSSQISAGLLDNNTKKYISNISYNKGSSGLPNNITININNGTVLAYIAADLTPSISSSSSIPSKIYYVSSIGNSANSEVSWSCYTQGLDTDSMPQNCKTTGSGSGGCGGTTRWNGSSCVPCLTGATCSGGIVTICPTGLYGFNCTTAVSSCTGYVNGTGEQATCITSCPASANCSGGAITSCNLGYYGRYCDTQCQGTISGTWPNLTCTPCSGSTPFWNGTSCQTCPANAICINGAITGCTQGYYGSDCQTQCQGSLSGTWPSLTCTPCSGSTPFWGGASCQSCPLNAICSNGAISGCSQGYYGSDCQTQCQGSLSGTWPSLTCQSCPSNANCSGGGINGCQTGYYGPNCNTLCTGIISGTWPHLSCQPCSGGTPYWNGSSCQQCPVSATCSNGSITGCSNGFNLVNGSCQCNSGLAVIAVNTLNNTTICYSACPWGSVLSGGTGETIGVSSCRCVNSGLAADTRNQSCSVSCSYLLPMYVGSARIENRVDQVRGYGGGYCSYSRSECSACGAWGYSGSMHPDGQSCLCY